ncbi:MAG: EF-hand domain-containing protein [Pseudolabrys sp.]|jgi:hypothetical protein
MSLSVGSAASSPLAYWQQLLQSGSASGASSGQSFDPLSALMQTGAGDSSSSASGSSSSGSSSASSPFGQDMMAQLISLQQQSSSGATGDPGDAKLFAKLDTDGDGSVSKSEFEAATSQHGIDSSVADAVFSKIDKDGDGSIGQGELAKADHAGRGHHGHHAGGAGGAGGQGGADDLMSGTSADGSTTQTTTNADGSTTTTISYADGSKIDTTTPATQASGGTGSSRADSGSNGSTSSKSSFNLIDQLIKLQSQVIGAATSSLSTIA